MGEGDNEKLNAVLESWVTGDVNGAPKIHFAAELKSQELFQRINRIPGATANLVAMCADLFRSVTFSDELWSLDDDFCHLFLSWFNRGFLEIRSINWSALAKILEKIIRHNAIHEITI